MTYMEIYQIVKNLVPADLREKYDHLSYGDMAEVLRSSPSGRRALAGRKHTGRRSRSRTNSQALARACKAAAEY